MKKTKFPELAPRGSKTVVRVANKLNNGVFSSPEDDFHLEREGKIENFWNSNLPSDYNYYLKHKNLKKFSMIGHYHRKSTRLSTLGSRSNTRIRKNLFATKQDNSIQRIIKKAIKGNSESTGRSSGQPVEKKSKQEKFKNKVLRRNKLINQHLAKATNKDNKDLIANKRKTTVKHREVNGMMLTHNLWHLSLRDSVKDKKIKGFLPVGNRLSGIYALITNPVSISRSIFKTIPSDSSVFSVGMNRMGLNSGR